LAHRQKSRDLETDCLLDCRSFAEFELWHIPWSSHMSLQDIPKKLEELKQYKHIFVYSHSDARSKQAVWLLNASWFEGVVQVLWWFEQRKHTIWSYDSNKKRSSIQQFFIVSGITILLCLLLSLLVSNWFLICVALISLLFLLASQKEAFVSQWMSYMPWNQSRVALTVREFHNKKSTIHIHQFVNNTQQTYSYAVWSENMMCIIDPDKDIEQYIDFSHQHQCTISAICLTDMASDFVLWHHRLAETTTAPVYVSPTIQQQSPYTHITQDAVISLGDARIVGHTWATTDDSMYYTIQEQSWHTFAIVTWKEFLFDTYPLSYTADQTARNDYFQHRYSIIQQIMQADNSVMLFSRKKIQDMTYCTIADQRFHKDTLWHLPQEQYIQRWKKQTHMAFAYQAYTHTINRQSKTSYVSDIPFLSHLDTHTTQDILDVRTFWQQKKYILRGALHIPYGNNFLSICRAVCTHTTKRRLLAQNDTQARNALHILSMIGYDTMIQSV